MHPDPSIPSPCVNVCKIDAAQTLCLGCARSLDEIARWSRADAAERLRIWRLLPARRATLGLAPVELPEELR